MGKNLSLEDIQNGLLEGSRLTAIKIVEPIYDKKGKVITRVECKCVCGTIKVFLLKSIRSGATYSCGCMQKEKAKSANTKYPNANKFILSSYNAMIGRCSNPNNHAYHLYGGNGVSVCEEWVKSYFLFEKWSLNNGWQKGLHIDKDIKGNGKLYSPDTCAWVTPKENSRHKSNSRKFLFNGKELSLSEICEIKGVKRATIDTRVRNGIDFEVAIEMPIKDKNLNLIRNKK